MVLHRITVALRPVDTFIGCSEPLGMIKACAKVARVTMGKRINCA